MCNIQPDCISEENKKNNENECISIESSEINKSSSLSDQILDDYRTSLAISKDAMSEAINKNFEKNYRNIIKLRNITLLKH